MELLQEYDAIQYFDTSIWFYRGREGAVREKIYKQDSCWIYFIKNAGHDVTSHTHPSMFHYESVFQMLYEILKILENDYFTIVLTRLVLPGGLLVRVGHRKHKNENGRRRHHVQH